MALFNEMNAGRIQRLLQRLLDIKGGPPAPQLSGDVTADLTLESDRPEWGYLKSEHRFFGVTSQGAGAQIEQSRFFAAAPGVLYVVEGCIVGRGASGYMDLRFHNGISGGAAIGSLANLDTYVPGDGRNGRIAANYYGSARLSHEAKAGADGVVGVSCIINANTVNIIPLNWVLVYPNLLTWNAQVAGQATNVSWIWRERQVMESELTGSGYSQTGF